MCETLGEHLLWKNDIEHRHAVSFCWWHCLKNTNEGDKVVSKSKKLREEISAQSSKIQTMNSLYRTKISTLDTKINFLSQKAQIASMNFLSRDTKRHNKQIEELEQLKLEKEKLEESHSKKIECEKQKLRDLRTEYKNNQTAFKEEDKEERRQKLIDLKDDIYFNKWKVIGWSVFFLVFFVIMPVLVAIGDNAKKAEEDEERQRNYYINIDDEATFDCNLSETHDSSYVACQSQSLSGDFSAYDTVELRYADITGNNFTYRDSYTVEKSLYEKDNFDINQLGDNLEHSVNLYIYNTVLQESVYEKEIKVRYKINDSDKALIQNKFESWKQWKAEEAEKAAEAEGDKKSKEEQEAAERAAAEKKTKEDAEKKNAEEAAKKQAEANAPSLDTIADACWYYGKTHSVHLLDYASDEITKDGSYYKIIMLGAGGYRDLWNCWYNPENKDTFIEKY